MLKCTGVFFTIWINETVGLFVSSFENILAERYRIIFLTCAFKRDERTALNGSSVNLSIFFTLFLKTLHLTFRKERWLGERKTELWQEETEVWTRGNRQVMLLFLSPQPFIHKGEVGDVVSRTRGGAALLQTHAADLEVLLQPHQPQVHTQTLYTLLTCES